MTKHNLLNISLATALISAILFSMVGFSEHCNEMYDSIIRIRILANSNSAEDQQLKINIRDAVLERSKSLFQDVDSYEEAVNATKDDLRLLCDTAQSVVYQEGYDYDVTVSLRDEYFETRKYDSFTLPAGTYKTAVFTVGQGDGENWWCVMFPQVCVGSCSAKLEDTVSEDAAEVAYSPNKYTVKFKTVEIFENIKKYFNF